MIGLLLAAGRGSRLGYLTENLPKSLLLLNETQTILEYNIQSFKKIGVDRILVVTGYKSEMIEEELRKHAGVTVVYNPFWDYCNVLGSLYVSLPYLNEDFLFLHADTVFDLKVWEGMVKLKSPINLAYARKKCGIEEMKVVISDNKLVRISKEIDPKLSDGEFLGFAKFSSEMISYIKKNTEKLFKTNVLSFYMEEVLQIAINDGIDIELFDIGNSKFIEIDFESDFSIAKQLFKLT